jgi:hypothetical protein
MPQTSSVTLNLQASRFDTSAAKITAISKSITNVQSLAETNRDQVAKRPSHVVSRCVTPPKKVQELTSPSVADFKPAYSPFASRTLVDLTHDLDSARTFRSDSPSASASSTPNSSTPPSPSSYCFAPPPSPTKSLDSSNPFLLTSSGLSFLAVLVVAFFESFLHRPHPYSCCFELDSQTRCLVAPVMSSTRTRWTGFFVR